VIQMNAKWLGEKRFVYRSATGHSLVSDAPAEVGGGDTAPTPMELVLLGLIGCTGVDVTSILLGMREPLAGLEVVAEAERADEHPRIYTKIHLIYLVSGPVNEKKVHRAVRLSESKYCSVSAMLAGATEITHEIQLMD